MLRLVVLTSTFVSRSLLLFVSRFSSYMGWMMHEPVVRNKRNGGKFAVSRSVENFQPKFPREIYSAGELGKFAELGTSRRVKPRFAAVQSILSEPERHSHARCTAVNPVLSKNEEFPLANLVSKTGALPWKKKRDLFSPPPRPRKSTCSGSSLE